MAKAKVMIVDDEQEIIRAVGMRLRAAGYEVTFATDASMAMQVAVRDVPDLVILDINMPCGTGFDVARRLRANAKTMLSPIIFLTAHGSTANRDQAAQAGAVAFITKPFHGEELLKLVEASVSKEG